MTNPKYTVKHFLTLLPSRVSITLELDVKVVRIKAMIINLGSSWLSIKFSLSVLEELRKEQCGEYEHNLKDVKGFRNIIK